MENRLGAAALKAALAGVFDGPGHGAFPTIPDFDYRDRTRFELSPKGFLIYGQTTWAAGDGAPLHQELGYLRIADDLSAEFVVAEPTGIAEVSLGSAIVGDEGIVIDLLATPLILSPTARRVTTLRRRLVFTEQFFKYQLYMATDVVPEMTLHLTGELERVGD